MRVADGRLGTFLVGAPAVARLVALAWLTFAGVYVLIGMAVQLIAGDGLPPARLVRFVPGLTFFASLVFLVSLVATSPGWLALLVARRRLSRAATTAAGALLFAAWGEWWFYRMEWFDVWRHGWPGWPYWLSTVVPVALACGAAGGVLGSAIGGRRPGGRRPPDA